MLNDNEDIQLLYQSLQELAAQLEENQLNTKSVSLVFLEMDLKYNVFEEVQKNILQYIAHRSSDEIKYSDLANIIHTALPDNKALYAVQINKIIIGFANCSYPKPQNIADDIKSEVGNTIYKYFDATYLE
ncbi:hypothetical protein BU586_08985 [Staphylococcus agnetis]|uniref:hypothetical protein n=1 Tax=Staphylococcus agnetis TaxID=985762 RepID=UPI000D1BEA81|nr:hypothetical protein [Staphylococcus agnetis]MCO4327726.1 hypothetical protein [Staphylococcus agnetis]MCO4339463.1 hypothetical protein [Staphylococcus agnetis]MCO4342057.1 hypothetical protein [Staphylococcus agnetis]MCO4344133.1 hypothetical protein [Staphylococcus agnetis]MCO4346420.1 hypothetical protein [Staphylococcus agnetis]